MSKPFIYKLQLVFKPFLLLFIGTQLGFMLLHWLMDVSFNVPIEGIEYICSYWIPVFAPLLLVIIYLRKPLRILKLGKTYTFYILTAYIIVIMPLDAAKDLILSLPYSLHKVENLSDIDTKNVHRFYSIENYEYKNSYAVTSTNESTLGKTIKLDFIAAMPLTDSIGKHRNYFWDGRTYSFQLNAKKRDRYYTKKTQLADSIRDLNTYIGADSTVYFEVLPSSIARDQYLGSIYSVYYMDHDVFILKPVDAPFNERNRPLIINFLKESILGILFFFLIILLPSLDVYALKRKLSTVFAWDNDEDEDVTMRRGILQFVVPNKEHLYITPILININLFIFVALVLGGNSIYHLNAAAMNAYGGNSISGLASGQVWRLFFNAFLHSGLTHLLGNMLSLAAIGAILEPTLGRRKFLAAYLATAFLGSIGSLMWNMHTVAAGASGPIFGMYGVLFMLLLLGNYSFPSKKLYWIVTIIHIVSGISLYYTEQIDHGAHIGGFVGGCIVVALFSIVHKIGTDRKLNYVE